MDSQQGVILQLESWMRS